MQVGVAPAVSFYGCGVTGTSVSWILGKDRGTHNAFRMLSAVSTVSRQLRCAGVLETVRIRRHGYPIRVPFPGFLGQFLCLSPSLAQTAQVSALQADSRGEVLATAASGEASPAFSERTRARETCKRLLKEVEARFTKQGLLVESDLWQVGKTKVSFRCTDKSAEEVLIRSAGRWGVLQSQSGRVLFQPASKRREHGLALSVFVWTSTASVRVCSDSFCPTSTTSDTLLRVSFWQGPERADLETRRMLFPFGQGLFQIV